MKFLRDVIGYNDTTIKETNTPFAVVQGVRVFTKDSTVCVEAHGDSRKGGKGVVINESSKCK